MTNTAIKVKQMTVHRYPDLSPDENNELATEERERFLLREVHYHPSGNILTDTEYDESGEAIEKFENGFDEKNRITEHRHYSGGELVERVTLEYDEAGRIVKELKHYEDGEPAQTIYVYDEKGQLTEKRVESSPGETEQRERFEYHPEGKDKPVLFEEFGYEDKLFRREKNRYELKEDKLILLETEHENMESGKKYKVVHHDPKAHEDNVANVVYDADDRIAEIVREWYDEKGNQVKMTHKTRSAANDSVVEFGYDDRGNMIMRRQETGTNYYKETRFLYNEHNLPAWQCINFGGSSTADVYSYELY
ncbi:MAG: hypothetical protein FD123_1367 [Bacteroidetes bacterium]|nr:MAG: hypothetical protein FD123_1367 [Bacteroidota bacterium]